MQLLLPRNRLTYLKRNNAACFLVYFYGIEYMQNVNSIVLDALRKHVISKWNCLLKPGLWCYADFKSVLSHWRDKTIALLVPCERLLHEHWTRKSKFKFILILYLLDTIPCDCWIAGNDGEKCYLQYLGWSGDNCGWWHLVSALLCSCRCCCFEDANVILVGCSAAMETCNKRWAKTEHVIRSSKRFSNGIVRPPQTKWNNCNRATVELHVLNQLGLSFFSPLVV